MFKGVEVEIYKNNKKQKNNNVRTEKKNIKKNKIVEQ